MQAIEHEELKKLQYEDEQLKAQEYLEKILQLLQQCTDALYQNLTSMFTPHIHIRITDHLTNIGSSVGIYKKTKQILNELQTEENKQVQNQQEVCLLTMR